MTYRTRSARRLVLTAALAVLACSSVIAQTGTPTARYKVIELPLKPVYISGTGEVCGSTADHRAAVWSQRRGLVLLPALPGFPESEARSSNRSGQVVGFFRSAEQSRAFVYGSGKLTLLSGERAKALGITDAGQIVGEAIVPGAKLLSPVFWNKKTMASLGGCCGGGAKAINRHGQMAGDVYDEKGRYRAVLWDASHKMRSLGPADRYSSAIAINDSGHVFVHGMESGLLLYLDREKVVHLPAPEQQPVDGRGLNNNDQVVGAVGPFFDADRAFLSSQENGFRDLNELLAPDSGWNLKMATGINDLGQIVGVGDHHGKEDVGFLLVDAKQ